MLFFTLLVAHTLAAPTALGPDAIALAESGPGTASSEALLAFAYDLSAAGLPLAAAPYAGAVTTRGPSDPSYEGALRLLVAAGSTTGDWAEIDGLPVGAPVPCCADALNYRWGLRALAVGDLDAGTTALKSVGAGSDLYVPAQLAAATAWQRQGKLKSSVRSYTMAAKASRAVSTPAALDESDRLTGRALLGIARIYVGIGQLEQAVLYYGTIKAPSAYASQAAVETAWLRLAMGDLAAASGALVPVPASTWIPEHTLLQLAIAVGRGDDGTAIASSLHTQVDPVRAALRAGADVSARETFARLPAGLAARMLRDRAFHETHTALAQVEREKSTLQAAKWKSVRDGLTRALDARRATLEAREAARLRELFTLHLALLDSLVTTADALVAAAPGEDAPARLARVNTLLIELPTDPEDGPPLRRGSPPAKGDAPESE